MIFAYRVVKEKHRKTAFSGFGARVAGGRWNRVGEPVVYTSSSLALAALETFVHLVEEAKSIQFVFFEVRIPDGVPVTRCERTPKGWRMAPAAEASIRYGSRWFHQQETAVLDIPSVLIPIERNYVLSPSHPDFPRIEISRPRPFTFDTGLWK